MIKTEIDIKDKEVINTIIRVVFEIDAGDKEEEELSYCEISWLILNDS